MFAVIGALAALEERHHSGRGQEVDVALYEAVAALMESSLADAEVAGVVRGRTGGVLPGVAPSNAYRTADGAEVLIAGNADSVFARLCEAMGRPDLAVDERYATHGARRANAAELDELIDAWTSTLAGGRPARPAGGPGRPERPGVHGRRRAGATRTTPPVAWCSG